MGSRLEIRVVTGRTVAGEPSDAPVVVLLVDGIEVLEGRGNGFGPETLLHQGDPLLPVEPPRRVGLYKCGCGDAGCGITGCLISESDGVIRWSGFRDFVGRYGPLDPALEDDVHSRAVDREDLVFDAAEYRAEVARAKADRTWETRPHRLGRLLKGRLMHQKRWDQLNLEFVSVWVWGDDADVFAIDLRRIGVELGQLVVGVRAPTNLDDDAMLDAVAAQVLAGDERTWFIIYDQQRPSMPARHEDVP
jgi:hypothetical protein